MYYTIAIVIFSIMHTFLHTKFKTNFQKYIQTYSKILIAISSGQDSLCLLKLLSDCLNKKTYHMQAIYIDYQWKYDSFNHNQHIINLMRIYKIPIIIYQAKNFTTSENQARQIRYQIFIRYALKKNIILL